MPLPNVKTTYVRPICGYTEDHNAPKELSSPQFDLSGNTATNGYDRANQSLTPIYKAKQKHIDKLYSEHTSLYAKMEQIEKLLTCMQLDSKQKNKRIDDLNQTIESQRKVVLNLQLDNENLSLQLNEEMQQRSLVMEKFLSAKEFYSGLKRHCDILREHFERRDKIEEMFQVADSQRLQMIEDIRNKFGDLCMEQSEKISYLHNSLTSETNKAINLKEAFEQQLVDFENQRESFLNMLRSSESEKSKLSEELQEFRKISETLKKEKVELETTILKLEKLYEETLCKLKDMENKLVDTENDKRDLEQSYLSQSLKVKELMSKCEEFEETSKHQKTQYEDNISEMNVTISKLDNELLELKEKLLKEDLRKKNLECALQHVKNEKNDLSQYISEVEKKLRLQESLKNEIEQLKETISILTEERKCLNSALEDTKKELLQNQSEKEYLSKLYSEKEEKLSKMSEEYETMVHNSEKLFHSNKEFKELSSKIKILEEDLKAKKDDNEKMLSKMENLEKDLEIQKRANEKMLSKIKILEDDLEVKKGALIANEEMLSKMKILEDDLESKKEIILTNEKMMSKIKILEEDLRSKEEVLLANENLMSKIKALEKELESKKEFILANEKMLSEMKILEKELEAKKEIIISNEKSISHLQTTVEENEIILDQLRYENIEMKDKLEAEKDSVKVCLECEALTEQVKEVENLRETLKKTKEELSTQKMQTIDVLRILSENEKIYEKDSISKEKEIIAQKEEIYRLEEELKYVKFQLDDCKKLKTENKTLKEDIEKLKSIQFQLEDCNKLKAENKKLKEDIKKMNSTQFQLDDCNKIKDEHRNLKTKTEKMKPQHSSVHVNNVNMTENNLKLKAASNQEENKPNPVLFSNIPEKRTFDVESSGSSEIEIILQQNLVETLRTSKRRPSQNHDAHFSHRTVNKAVTSTPLKDVITLHAENPRKTMRMEKRTPLQKFSPFNGKKPFTSKPLQNVTTIEIKDVKVTPKSQKLVENTQLLQTENISPWMKKKVTPVNMTPNNKQRKFFKTPLAERREASYKREFQDFL